MAFSLQEPAKLVIFVLFVLCLRAYLDKIESHIFRVTSFAMIHAPDGEAVLGRATEIVEGGRGRNAEPSDTRQKNVARGMLHKRLGAKRQKLMVRPERFELPACCF